MALFKRKHEDFCLLLISILYILPLSATFNNDCNGKSFHCVNSTHFMICVDVGGGVSMTVDNFVIQCPPTTFCQSTNNFECEYQESTTQSEAIEKSEVTNDPTLLNVISLDEVSSQMPMLLEDGITSVLPLEKFSISSKPSKISETNIKEFRPNAVSNIIKKDVIMPKMVQHDIPESDTGNGLDFNDNVTNNSQSSFTETKTELNRVQNNISPMIETNFTDASSAIKPEKVITNIPNITETVFEINNKESNSSGSLPVLENIKTIDMFSKIPKISSYNHSKYKPEAEESINGDYISPVNITNDTITNQNVKVTEEQNFDSKIFLINGTLINALSNHSELENKHSHNVSLNVNGITDNIINYEESSALTELKPPIHFITSQYIKPELMSLETSTIASANNSNIEMKVRELTNNYGNIYFFNGTSNSNNNASEMAKEQYQKYDISFMNNTLPKKSFNYTELENLQSQNVDPTVHGEIKNFTNNEYPIIPIEDTNSSALSNAFEYIKSSIVSPTKQENSINYNSNLKSHLKNITDNNVNIDSLNISSNEKYNAKEQYPKNDRLFLNSTLSNKLVNNMKLENIQSQNIDKSVNGEINNFGNSEDSTIPSELRNSSAPSTESQNIKSGTMYPDEHITISYIHSDMGMQTQNGTDDSEKLYSTKINSNVNSTLSNELINNTKLQNVQSQNIDKSVNGEINNYGNTEDPTIPSELWKSSAPSTESENIKSGTMYPDEPITISYIQSDMEMQTQNGTDDGEELYSTKINSNANATSPNELINNTKLQNVQSQNIDLSVKGELNNYGNTEDPTIPSELWNSSAPSTESENIKSGTMSPNEPKTINYIHSDIEMQTQNGTNYSGKLYSTKINSSAKIDANINMTEEQYPDKDNLFHNATLSNELMNNTKLQNILNQIMDLGVNREINNFGNIEDSTISVELRNSSAPSTESLNIKSGTMHPDEPITVSYIHSDMGMQTQNGTDDGEKLYSTKINPNVNATLSNELINNTKLQNVQSQNIDLSVKGELNNYGNTEDPTIPSELWKSSAPSTESQNIKSGTMYPDEPITISYIHSDMGMQTQNGTDDGEKLYSTKINSNVNATLSNELINNTKLQNVQSQNIDLSVKGELNNYGNTEDPTIPSELWKSFTPSTQSENIKSGTMSPDEPKTINYIHSDIGMQTQNGTHYSGKLYNTKINSNVEIDANINKTEDQYPEKDNLFHNTSLSNELINNVKLQNIQSQNIDLIVNGEINTFGNIEDSTIPSELRNLFAPSTESENIKFGTMSPAEPNTVSYIHSDIGMQSQNGTDNSGKLYSTKINSSAKIDANINMTEEKYPKKDNLLRNATLSNELINNTKLQIIQSQNIDLRVNGEINNFGNTEDSTISSELRNSFAPSTEPENIKFGTMSPDDPNTVSYIHSDIGMQAQNGTDKSGKLYSTKINSNAKIDANINMTEEKYPEKDNLLHNATLSNELIKNTKLQNIKSQNIDLIVNGEINNFGNTEDSTISSELRNSFAPSTESENIKFGIMSPAEPNTISYIHSDIGIQAQNGTDKSGKLYSTKINSNAKIDANINMTEEQYPDKDNLFHNATLSNELINNTKLQNIQSQHIDLRVNGEINNFGNTEDTTIPSELWNSSAPSTEPKNIKFGPMPPAQPKTTSYIHSDIGMQTQNGIDFSGKLYSTKMNSNRRIDVDINKTEEQYPDKDNLFHNATSFNELINNTKLQNIQSQNIHLSVNGEINNFGNTDDLIIPSESRNSSASFTEPENIKSRTMSSDEPKTINYIQSDIGMLTQNGTDNSGKLHFTKMNSNAKIDENLNMTEEKYPEKDNLLRSATLSNELNNNKKFQIIQSQNIDLRVNGEINNFGNIEDSTISSELRNSSAPSTEPENIKSGTMSPDEPKTINYIHSDIGMQTQNGTDNIGKLYSTKISSNAKIDANINMTEEQYPKKDNLLHNATVSNELVNNTKLQNIQSQNIDNAEIDANLNTTEEQDPKNGDLFISTTLLNELINNTKMMNILSQNVDLSVNEKVNDLANTEDRILRIELRNLSAQLSASKNIKSEIMSPDKHQTSSNYDSNIERQLKEINKNSQNIYSLNNSSNAKYNVNMSTTGEQYSNNDKMFINTSLLNELVNNTKLKNMKSERKNLSVNGVKNDFGNKDDPTVPTDIRNSSVQLTSYKNIEPDVMLPNQPKITSNNSSSIEMQMEKETNNNVFNVSLNDKIDANISTTAEQYPENDKPFLNTTYQLSTELFNNTQFENIQSQNVNLFINGEFDNSGNNDDPILLMELKNSSVQSTSAQNIKPKTMPSDIFKVRGDTHSKIEMQVDNDTNNNFINRQDPTVPIELMNSSAQSNKSENIKTDIKSPHIPKITNNNSSVVEIENSTEAILEILSFIDTFPAYTDSQQVYNSTKAGQFNDMHKNMSISVKNAYVTFDNMNQKAKNNTVLEINPIYGNENSNTSILTSVKNITNNNILNSLKEFHIPKEDWHNVTESDILKGTKDVIQPTLSSATAIDNSFRIFSNMQENVKKAEHQPNNKYYNVLTVTKKITQSTSETPNLVDRHAIMNSETLVNNTSNDEYLLNGVEIFKNNSDFALYNGAHSVSIVKIPNIKTQENITNTHETYKVDNDQNDFMYVNNNIPQTNVKPTIIFNNAAKLEVNYSRIENYLNDTQRILNMSVINDIENTTQSLQSSIHVFPAILDKTIKNISNPIYIATTTETYFKASPKTLTLFQNSEVIVNEKEVNSSLTKVNIEGNDYSVLSGNENYTQTISEESGILIVKENTTTNYSSKINTAAVIGSNTGLNELNNSVLINMVNSTETTTDVMITTDKPFLATYTSHDINNLDENVHINDVETSTQTILSVIASNFKERQVVNATGEVNSALSTSFGDKSKKNIPTITNREILFGTDTPTVGVIKNISNTININVNKLSTAGNQHPAVKPELQPLIRQTNNYRNKTSFPNIVHKNGTIINTGIKSLLLSSKVTNLPSDNRPIKSSVNSKIFHYNGTKTATLSSKELGAKYFRVGYTTDNLKFNDKAVTKISPQTYTVSHGNTNSNKLPPVSSGENINTNYSVESSLNLTNNKNYKVDKIQLNNTADKMHLRYVTTGINYNKVVRNTGLAVTTTDNSLAFKNNESKVIKTVKMSSDLEDTRIKPAFPNFFCRNNSRGRFADESNCRRFYICIGNIVPILGLCPENTVFSEFRKQCTKNFSHCITHNQFKCLKEGRFSDALHENIYYICIKSAHQKFVSFKFQCQNGYRLDKTNVICNKVITMPKSGSLSSSTTSKDEDIKTIKKTIKKNLEPNKSLKPKSFKCEIEGKFPDPSNCRRYYVCSKTSKLKLRRKRKKCDSDEIFDDDKNKCVDKDSHECK